MLVVRPNAKGRIPWTENVRAALSRWFFEDRLAPLTQTEIDAADSHQAHVLHDIDAAEAAEIAGAEARAHGDARGDDAEQKALAAGATAAAGAAVADAQPATLLKKDAAPKRPTPPKKSTTAKTAAAKKPAAKAADASIDGVDLVAGRKALGRSRKLDPNDLTVVEGVGPKVAGILNGAGIHTWSDLAATPVSTIQELLDAAGSRYNMHNPSTWPQQAGLLQQGEWEQFKALTNKLDGGVAE